MTGIRINLSDKEATSESRDIAPLPNGKYLMAVTEITEEECGPNSKNPGKPYYNLELTVQDGEYEDRKVFTNAMLFEGALYTIVQILKALDVPFQGTSFQVDGYDSNVVPDAEWFMGQQMVVSVFMVKGKLKQGEPKGGERYNDRPEPKGFWPARTWQGPPTTAKAVTQGVSSLMP